MEPTLMTHRVATAIYLDRLEAARRRLTQAARVDAPSRKDIAMTPYSATDLIRAIRHAHGIPENVPVASEPPSRIWRWMTTIFQRAWLRPR